MKQIIVIRWVARHPRQSEHHSHHSHSCRSWKILQIIEFKYCVIWANKILYLYLMAYIPTQESWHRAVGVFWLQGYSNVYLQDLLPTIRKVSQNTFYIFQHRTPIKKCFNESVTILLLFYNSYVLIQPNHPRHNTIFFSYIRALIIH